MTSAVRDIQYSVQVKSRFDLLGNDDFNNEDPDLLLKKMKSQRSEAKAPKEVVAPKAAVSEKRSETNQRDRRGGRPEAATDAAPRTESRETRGRGNRGGFTRNRPARSGGQREFDRHSGSDKTGVKAVMKKDGHGTGNWGTMEDELEAQTAELSLEAPVDEEAPTEAAAEAETEPVEEEPKTLTLKEYRDQEKALKGKVQLTTKGTRRANDGKNVFSNMVEVHKSKPAETKVEVVLEEEAVGKASEPAFFEFGRGRSQPRGRGGPRPSGTGEFRGGRGGARFEHRDRENTETASNAQSAAPTEDRPSRGGRGGERGSRGGERGARGGERGSRGGRGRGAPRGSFNPERGGGRGGATGDRPSFRGGERGGRGSRGGPRGGFRGGRGGSEQHVGEHRQAAPQNTAPVMDSDLDFPALK